MKFSPKWVEVAKSVPLVSMHFGKQHTAGMGFTPCPARLTTLCTCSPLTKTGKCCSAFVKLWTTIYMTNTRSQGFFISLDVLKCWSSDQKKPHWKALADYSPWLMWPGFISCSAFYANMEHSSVQTAHAYKYLWRLNTPAQEQPEEMPSPGCWGVGQTLVWQQPAYSQEFWEREKELAHSSLTPDILTGCFFCLGVHLDTVMELPAEQVPQHSLGGRRNDVSATLQLRSRCGDAWQSAQVTAVTLGSCLLVSIYLLKWFALIPRKALIKKNG